MPIPGYPSFTACHADQLKKGKTNEEANKICGALQAQVTGASNFVESTLDASGDLYLKYWFADSGVSDHPNADQQYLSFNKEALDAKDNEAIGLPFAILPKRELSLKFDYHPWHPKGGAATYDEHLAFARNYSPGHIVAITKDTKLTGAAIEGIKQNNGRFAIVKITDQRARDAFRKDPSLIPKQVSPGYLNFEAPNYANIRNFKWVHLAAVPRGAFEKRSTVYASCLGGNECINNLVGASVAELDEKTRSMYCPVGASENLSSLGDSETLFNSMSVNANTAEQATPPAPATPPVSATAPPPTPPKGAPITTGTGTPKIVRLKTNVTPQGNQAQTNAPEGNDDITKLKEEVAKMREIQQQNERREQIKKLIPKELFINKGKFDEKAFEAEVEKRLQSGASDDALNEFYTLWLDKQKLINAGYTLPQEAPPQMEIPNAPTGGSYQTPSDVPTGGSAKDDYVTKSITELLRFTVRRE